MSEISYHVHVLLYYFVNKKDYISFRIMTIIFFVVIFLYFRKANIIFKEK